MIPFLMEILLEKRTQTCEENSMTFKLELDSEWKLLTSFLMRFERRFAIVCVSGKFYENHSNGMGDMAQIRRIKGYKSF